MLVYEAKTMLVFITASWVQSTAVGKTQYVFLKLEIYYWDMGDQLL